MSHLLDLKNKIAKKTIRVGDEIRKKRPGPRGDMGEHIKFPVGGEIMGKGKFHGPKK